jgi:hypothetical protein
VARHGASVAARPPLAALQELHSIFYALPPALDFTVDAAAPLIGRLMEIDRRIVLIERLRPFNC